MAVEIANSGAQQGGMLRLVTTIQELALATKIEEVQNIVRTTARALTNCDGATFVLRDGDLCHYLDEDAIGPLWKGQRFPLTSCISGWAMLNKQSVIIPDIYLDDRIPHGAYRPTFVNSLVMVPIRAISPIGAIGNYWAKPHTATMEEVALLAALANVTSIALENVRVNTELHAARERERDLEVEIGRETESLTSLAASLSSQIERYSTTRSA